MAGGSSSLKKTTAGGRKGPGGGSVVGSSTRGAMEGKSFIFVLRGCNNQCFSRLKGGLGGGREIKKVFVLRGYVFSRSGNQKGVNQSE